MKLTVCAHHARPLPMQEGSKDRHIDREQQERATMSESSESGTRTWGALLA